MNKKITKLKINPLLSNYKESNYNHLKAKRTNKSTNYQALFSHKSSLNPTQFIPINLHLKKQGHNIKIKMQNK